MRAIQISAFGNPSDVLGLIDLPEPPAPDFGQALIGVEFAPLNHNDLLLIRGTFHYLPKLPAIIGNEGVDVILAIGNPDPSSHVIHDAGRGHERALTDLPQAHGTRAGVTCSVQEARGEHGRNVYSLGFHSLRRAFNTDLANSSVSQEIRQRLIGHESAKSTIATRRSRWRCSKPRSESSPIWRPIQPLTQW